MKDMGEVFKPEAFTRRRRTGIPDITPKPVKPPSPPLTPETFHQEIREIREELTKIKEALRRHGIHVD